MKDNARGAADKPLRLLMVNTVRSACNGQTLFILKYLRAMDLSGMAVGYACWGEPDPVIRAALETAGATVYVLPHRNRRPLSYARALRRLARREGWEIVHVHGNSATMAVDLWAARLGGARVRIAHSHNTGSRFPLLNRLLGPAFRAATNVRFACGDDAGRWLFGGMPFEVVPIAADPEVFRFNPETRARLRDALGADGGTFLAGVVASFIPAKNHLFLLDAFAKARARRKDLRLALIGDGPLRGEIDAAVKRLGLGDSVVLTGVVSNVPDCMGALDALLLPSLHEGFPNVLVEAQLSGLPALVSDRVTRDCDMSGLLTYLPLDADAWTDALARLTPGDRAADCERGRAGATSRGFDIRSAAAALRERYFRLYNEYMG